MYEQFRSAVKQNDCGTMYILFELRLLYFVVLTLLASSIHVCFLSSSSTPIPITVSLQTKRLKMLVSVEGEKTRVPGARREPTTNSTHL